MNYYTDLQVSHTASLDDLTKAYTKKSKSLIKMESGSLKESLLTNLDEAFCTLSDSSKRKKYDEELSNNVSEQVFQLDGTEVIDFANYRTQDQLPWGDVAGGDCTGKDYMNLFKEVLYLPRANIQLPILVSALLSPSALCNTLPFVFAWGQPGSGKSLICKIAAKTWGCEAFSSASTPVSIRNHIQSGKYIYVKGREYESNVGIVINDFSEKAMKSVPLMVSLLKAFNRDESKILISSPEKDGTNIEFDIFSNRIISSIVPFFGMPEYSELARRMLVIHCTKVNAEAELTSINDIDLNPLSVFYKSLWQDKDNCTKLSKLKMKKKGILSSDRFDTVKDVLRVGVTLGIFGSESEASDVMSDFEALTLQLTADYGDNTKMLLRDFLEFHLREKEKFSQPLNVNPMHIKSFLVTCFRESKIEHLPTQGKINNLMKILGYSYNPRSCYWSKDE